MNKISRLILVLSMLFGCRAFADDRVNIIVYSQDFTGALQNKLPVTLTPISPLPRVYYSNLFVMKPITLSTDTNGIVTFTNVLWGNYNLTLQGNPPAVYALQLSTNLSGNVQATTVITNPATLPPDPATNYFTQAQTLSLIGSVSVSNAPFKGDSTQFGTNSITSLVQITNGARLTNVVIAQLLTVSNLIVSGPTTNLPAVWINNTLSNSVSGVNGQAVIYDSTTPGGIKGTNFPALGVTNISVQNGLTGVTNGLTVTLSNTVPPYAASNNVTITLVNGTNYIASTSSIGNINPSQLQTNGSTLSITNGALVTNLVLIGAVDNSGGSVILTNGTANIFKGTHVGPGTNTASTNVLGQFAGEITGGQNSLYVSNATNVSIPLSIVRRDTLGNFQGYSTGITNGTGPSIVQLTDGTNIIDGFLNSIWYFGTNQGLSTSNDWTLFTFGNDIAGAFHSNPFGVNWRKTAQELAFTKNAGNGGDLIQLAANLDASNIYSTNITIQGQAIFPNAMAATLVAFDETPKITNVAAGTNGQVLVADNTKVVGVKWTNFPTAGSATNLSPGSGILFSTNAGVITIATNGFGTGSTVGSTNLFSLSTSTNNVLVYSNSTGSYLVGTLHLLPTITTAASAGTISLSATWTNENGQIVYTPLTNISTTAVGPLPAVDLNIVVSNTTKVTISTTIVNTSGAVTYDLFAWLDSNLGGSGSGGGGGGGSGTVTSVAISTPNYLTVAGSPIITSGTFALTGNGNPATFDSETITNNSTLNIATINSLIVTNGIVDNGPATNRVAVWINHILTNGPSGSDGQLLVYDAATAGGFKATNFPASGAGSVTSVSGPNWFTWANSTTTPTATANGNTANLDSIKATNGTGLNTLTTLSETVSNTLSVIGGFTNSATSQLTGITNTGNITNTGTIGVAGGSTFTGVTNNGVEVITGNAQLNTVTANSLTVTNGIIDKGPTTNRIAVWINNTLSNGPAGSDGQAIVFDAATPGGYKATNFPAGGSGSVTSVALSLPAYLTVSGSPVTTSGTLTAVGNGTTATFDSETITNATTLNTVTANSGTVTNGFIVKGSLQTPTGNLGPTNVATQTDVTNIVNNLTIPTANFIASTNGSYAGTLTGSNLIVTNIVATGPTTNRIAVWINNTLSNGPAGTDGQAIVFDAATPGGYKATNFPAGGGSQSPWSANENAAGFALTNLGFQSMTGPLTNGGASVLNTFTANSGVVSNTLTANGITNNGDYLTAVGNRFFNNVGQIYNAQGAGIGTVWKSGAGSLLWTNGNNTINSGGTWSDINGNVWQDANQNFTITNTLSITNANNLTQTPLFIQASTNNYAQVWLQNTNAGSNAAMALVIGNDKSATNSTTNYIEMWANSSVYSNIDGGTNWDFGVTVAPGGTNFYLINAQTNGVIRLSVGGYDTNYTVIGISSNFVNIRKPISSTGITNTGTLTNTSTVGIAGVLTATGITNAGTLGVSGTSQFNGITNTGAFTNTTTVGIGGLVTLAAGETNKTTLGVAGGTTLTGLTNNGVLTNTSTAGFGGLITAGAGITNATTLGVAGASQFNGITNTGTFTNTSTVGIGGLVTLGAGETNATTLGVAGGTTLTGVTNNGAMTNSGALNVGGIISGGGSGLTNIYGSGLSYTNVAAASPTNYTVTFGASQIYNYINGRATNVCFNAFSGTQGPVTYFVQPGGTNMLVLWPTNQITLQTNGLTLNGTNWSYQVTNKTQEAFVISFFAMTNVTSNPSGTNIVVAWQDGNSSPLPSALVANSLVASNSMLSQHIGGFGTSPTVVTNAGAGGASGTVTLDANATDAAMQVTLTTGTIASPSANATIFTVTFNKAYATAPHVIFCPGNSAASALSGVTMVFAPIGGTSTCTLTSGATALTGATTYVWNLHVIQ